MSKNNKGLFLTEKGTEMILVRKSEYEPWYFRRTSDGSAVSGPISNVKEARLWADEKHFIRPSKN